MNVEAQIQAFKTFELVKFLPPIPGTDFVTKYFPLKKLPPVVFDPIYPGGKEEAMGRRRKKRDADPFRIEMRKQKKLAEMKAKLQAAKDVAEAKKAAEDAEKGEGEGGEDIEEGEGGLKQKIQLLMAFWQGK